LYLTRKGDTLVNTAGMKIREILKKREVGALLDSKHYIVFENWIENLNFSAVPNILKISTLGFFANLKFCP
jgi:hypothetical protein